MSIKIVFMGTSEFSVPTLKFLIEKKFNVLQVYTQPPKKSKRGQKIHSSPVELFSKQNEINCRTPSNLNNDGELKIFKELLPDIAIVVSYGQIIPKNFLNIPKFGFINIHASLLPKWRGAAPIQRAIMNEDKKTGVSIMKIEEKLDSGPVLSSQTIDLDKTATFGDIEKKLSIMGANLLIKNLENMENNSANFSKQIHSEATYAKKIHKNETKINWNLSANKVIAHIHGLSPNPGAWLQYEKERYKVLKAIEHKTNGKPGTVIDENLTIACKLNSVRILELQRQGKKKQTAKEFLLGKKIKKESILK